MMLKGALVGAGAGALFGYLLSRDEGESTTKGFQSAVSSYTYLRKNNPLVAALQDPFESFNATDSKLTEKLLSDFDELMKLYFVGEPGRSATIASALKVRRRISTTLEKLIRESRRAHPYQEMSEDFDVLRKFVVDMMHNIQQEHSVRLMSSCTTEGKT
jgi:hypothetical protein